MPREMNRLILNYFGVKDSLLDFSAKQMQNIINSNIHFSYAQETDYNGKMDNYILSYMLVNFYKIWAPLYQLLKKGCLKKICKCWNWEQGREQLPYRYGIFISC